ncbi:MAG: radical SAM protein [Candidatus Marinimicrobia bacterium]|nr:radical SAM protein [Candidatus Neomarinimicrobiota bacterium]|tara:strand:+ start:372 stop:1661 length:1290 start_codon:yes stop_codon:yes gene_type:complete
MVIVDVNNNQLGSLLGLKPGDRLLRINGRKVMDELDYQFRIIDSKLLIEFEINGNREEFEIEKDFDEDLGVQFEELKIRKCANDCVFCFVDQNPEGMRDGMYFRDGDYRLSFLYGHYITLTNLGQNELNRIVEQRMSPLYVSVHATDPDLRKKLLLYKKDDNFIEKIQFLTKNGIELHCQVVLIPDENDGEHLIKTIKDLYEFYPILNSLSIVPVGLTEHRKDLMNLKTVTKDYALKFIPQIETYKKDYPSNSSSFFFLSDEWYILSELDLPKSEEYGDFSLIENGVGQVRNFLNIFESEKKEILEIIKNHKLNFTIGCGTLIYPIFIKYLMPFFESQPNLEIKIIPIVNNFFGESVTVSGLLSGKDIIQQLTGRNLGNSVWFSNRILNDEQTLTVDDFSLEDLSKKIDRPVKVMEDSILNIIKEEIKN